MAAGTRPKSQTLVFFEKSDKATMLFEEYSYFNYPFPDPQYLGAKHTHLAWIKKFIPQNVTTALDAFSGSQSVAFLFKQLGFKTLTNDFLNFNHQIGLALIENNNAALTAEDYQVLMQPAKNKTDFRLMETTFTNVFFEKTEAAFLDNFRANIPLLANPYKQALAFTVINRSMTRKVTMGHFAHTQAMRYAGDPERIKRNRSLVRPLKDIFDELLPKYNQAVFDNKQPNQSYNQNILDLLPTLPHIDLAYFDPPYCDSHADYQSFYHLLETFTEYWQDKQFINGIKRYDPQRHSGFDKKRDVVASFEKLFEGAAEIPYWLISYNNRSYPSVNEFEKMIAKHRHVKIETKTYQNGRGGKGSVAGSQEILFVCKPKQKFVFNTGEQKQLVNEGL
jgi:adenine-specific DNA-methyltransferase